MEPSPLARWLVEETAKRHISWNEACRQAGVAPNTISQIVSGMPPGVKRLLPLAQYFGVSADYFLRLAGHLPPVPDVPDLDAFAQAQLDEIRRIAASLPKELQQEFMARLLDVGRSLSRFATVSLERDGHDTTR